MSKKEFLDPENIYIYIHQDEAYVMDISNDIENCIFLMAAIFNFCIVHRNVFNCNSIPRTNVRTGDTMV